MRIKGEKQWLESRSCVIGMGRTSLGRHNAVQWSRHMEIDAGGPE